MSDMTPLVALPRDRAGKGAARATRRAGRVPAVIYGNNQTPVLISVDPKILMHEMEAPGFYIRQFEIKVNGESHRVMARDVQRDPVTDRPLHVDFLRVTDQTRITVFIPVVFINEELSPGLKRGGVLNVVRREVEVTTTVGNIPKEFVLDLQGMEIGDSAHISQVDLPEGVRPVIADRDFTIATVAAPTVVREEAAAEAAAAEEVEEEFEAGIGEEEAGAEAESQEEKTGEAGGS